MPKRIPPVTLSESEQQTLQALVNQGQQSARQIKRAQILLHSHAGKRPEDIAAWLGTSLATVYNTRAHYQRVGCPPPCTSNHGLVSRPNSTAAKKPPSPC